MDTTSEELERWKDMNMPTTIMDGKCSAIFITGKPGTGKSTLIRLISNELSQQFKIGGIVTPEVREHGKRTGFKVVDLTSKKGEIFAHVSFRTKFRVGRYFVDVKKFESIAIPAIETAIEKADLIVIDEIGKMEFFSKKFRSLIQRILVKKKPLLAVLHRSFVTVFKNYGKIYELKKEMFEEIKNHVKRDVEKLLL